MVIKAGVTHVWTPIRAHEWGVDILRGYYLDWLGMWACQMGVSAMELR